MKKMLLLWLCLLAAAGCTKSGKSPQCEVEFRVIDDARRPVEHAQVTARTFREWVPGPGFGHSLYDEFLAITDDAGVAKLSFPSRRGDFDYSVAAGGAFYGTSGLRHKFEFSDNHVWHPKNPALEVQLRAKVAPVPLYVRSPGVFEKPLVLADRDKDCGFDLMAGDWVKPFGKGEVADFFSR